MNGKVKKFLLGYYQYLQTLVLAGFFYALVVIIWRFVLPEQIANWPLPDTYLPLQLPLLAGNFLFFTFLGQNRKFGLWVSLVIFAWLFWRLQHFIITWPLVVSWLTGSLFLVVWIFWPELKSWGKNWGKEKQTEMVNK